MKKTLLTATLALGLPITAIYAQDNVVGTGDSAVNSYAEEPNLQVEVPSADAVNIEFPTATGNTSQTAIADEETISVDFPGEDVKTVIRNVAELYDLNVVIPESLQGTTSIKLKNVTWKQVFNVVLEPLGYDYTIEENIVKIVSKDALRQELKPTVFAVKYADAQSLLDVVSPMIDTTQGARIQVDPRTNALIITASQQVLIDISKILAELDDPVLLNGQIALEAKFIEAQINDRDNLGIDWGNQVTLGDVAGIYAWEPFSTGYFDNDANVSAAVDGDDAIILPNGPTNYTTVSGAYTSILSAPAFTATLNYLNQDQNSRLVSNPSLVTLNNTEAEIRVAEERPIPDYTYNEDRGIYEISGFEYKPIGIIMKVRPQITGGGESINLRIEPELSSSTEDEPFNSGGAEVDIPIVNTREVKTEVVLKDGYTLAIGGLIEQTTSEATNSVPLLGDIPLLGKLFQNQNVSKDKTNLLMFITAKILSLDNSSYENTVDPRQLQELQLNQSDIPGYKWRERELFPEDQRRQLERLFEMRTQIEEKTTKDQLDEKETELDNTLNPPPPDPEAEESFSNPRARH